MYGPGAWPNQEQLDRIGVDHWADDYFIDAVREGTSPSYHKGTSDYDLFEMARNICGSLVAYGMTQVGSGILQIAEGLTDFRDGDQGLQDVLISVVLMIGYYCDEYSDEFMDWIVSQGG